MYLVSPCHGVPGLPELLPHRVPCLGLRPHGPHPGAIQGKEGIKFCHLATLVAAPKEPIIRDYSTPSALKEIAALSEVK